MTACYICYYTFFEKKCLSFRKETLNYLNISNVDIVCIRNAYTTNGSFINNILASYGVKPVTNVKLPFKTVNVTIIIYLYSRPVHF